MTTRSLLSLFATRTRFCAATRTIVRENLAILDAWISENPHFYYTKPQAGTTALVYYDFDVPSYDFCKRLYDETGAFVTPAIALSSPRACASATPATKKTLEDGPTALARFAETPAEQKVLPRGREK